MITWSELISMIEKLETLENGIGSEIEFSFAGIEYCICSYGHSCDISKRPNTSCNSEEITRSYEKMYTYSNLTELGRAKDIGFSIEEEWQNFDYVDVKPDFIEYGLEVIFEAYERVLKSKRKHK